MKELSDIEKEILNVILKYYPNSWNDIYRAWELTESFDEVIKLLEYSNSHGSDIEYSYDKMYNIT